MSSKKAHKALHKALKERGVVITMGSKHPKAKFPSGEMMTLHVSPSDRRAYLNQVARARRFLNDPDFMRG